MYCKYCGKPIADGSTTCPYCQKNIRGFATGEGIVLQPTGTTGPIPVQNTGSIPTWNTGSIPAPAQTKGSIPVPPIPGSTGPIPVPPIPGSTGPIPVPPVGSGTTGPIPVPPLGTGSTDNKKKKKELNLKPIILGVVVVAVIALGVIFVPKLLGGGSKKLDVTAGCSVYYDGYNGYATANVSSDCVDSLIMKVYDDNKKLIEKANDKGYFSLKDKEQLKLDAISEFINSLYVVPEEKDHLSNGDSISITMNCDPFVANTLGYEIVNKTKEFVVSGLEEPKGVDYFDGITLGYEMVDGSFVLYMHGEEKYMDMVPGLDYYASNNSNGYVTLSLNYDAETLANQGFEALNGVTSQEFYVGKKPERAYHNTSGAAKDAAVAAAEEGLLQAINNCGWNIYVGNRQVLIQSYSVKEVNRDAVRFNVQLEDGKTLIRTVRYVIYDMGDGNFYNATPTVNNACTYRETRNSNYDSWVDD